MAKKTYEAKMLVNEEVKTKTKYMVNKPTRGEKVSEKLRLRKYDPVTRKHHWFVEKKLPNPKAK